jgi:hypothetical protein
MCRSQGFTWSETSSVIKAIPSLVSREVVSKDIDHVILNLFQDPNALYVRPQNKFGVTISTTLRIYRSQGFTWSETLTKFYFRFLIRSMASSTLSRSAKAEKRK